MNKNILNIENLRVAYNRNIVISNMNLKIFENTIHGIIGPSGCGKSTLLKSISNLTTAQTSIDGIINYKGKNINTFGNTKNLNLEIGHIFQNPTPLPLSIGENIGLALKEHGFDNIHGRVEMALKKVGLWDEVSQKLNSSALELSGGQAQRLCIARSIALQPNILLMDEPCSSLDHRATKVIEELILKLKEEYTIVIVTHNIQQAKRICDYVSLCCPDTDGICRVIETNTTNNFFNNPETEILKHYIHEA